jgi:sterol desaturase/sphingolipid hydroxylase (fatty acid hydroxylase superfamily)
MPRPNPFAVEFVPKQSGAFSLFELMLFPAVVGAAYLLFQKLQVFALAFYLGLFVIDGVICLFDASQVQQAEDSYRTGRWRRRMLSAILGATFGVIPLYLLYLLGCAFYPKLEQYSVVQIGSVLTSIGAGLGYCFPRVAYFLLWLVAVILRLPD